MGQFLPISSVMLVTKIQTSVLMNSINSKPRLHIEETLPVCCQCWQSHNGNVHSLRALEILPSHSDGNVLSVVCE